MLVLRLCPSFEKARLVSVMAVKNGIGIVEPMEEIGRICKEFNLRFYIDVAQALGKILIDVKKWNEKINVSIEPHINNGGQERGIQSETILTPLVMRMGAAYKVVKREMEYNEKRISALQERLLNEIK
ncbi:hypothetical protein VNO77_39015 [Canavalia gladiata]|uniref:Aminotransferase class V domain-containing protein n=1 Tax=Canavalia gladiata TaxID=3824 RepID=A0AAN9KCL8_CANGL